MQSKNRIHHKPSAPRDADKHSESRRYQANSTAVVMSAGFMPDFDIAALLTLKAYFLPLTSLALLFYRQKAVALDAAEKAIAAPATSCAAIELI